MVSWNLENIPKEQRKDYIIQCLTDYVNEVEKDRDSFLPHYGEVIDIAELYKEIIQMLNENKAGMLKTGEWIRCYDSVMDEGWKCSECNYIVKIWNNTPYCPRCGVKMKEAYKKTKQFGDWTVKEWQRYCNKNTQDEDTIEELMDKCNACQFHPMCDDVANGWDITQDMEVI